METTMSVEAQCNACAGTGVYCGFAEPKGTGVACLKCGSSGKVLIEYIPFTGRKRRDDVTTIRLSRGTSVGLGVGPTGGSVSYEEFLEGKMPTEE
jgi:hypothetical protein